MKRINKNIHKINKVMSLIEVYGQIVRLSIKLIPRAILNDGEVNFMYILYNSSNQLQKQFIFINNC